MLHHCNTVCAILIMLDGCNLFLLLKCIGALSLVQLIYIMEWVVLFLLVWLYICGIVLSLKGRKTVFEFIITMVNDYHMLFAATNCMPTVSGKTLAFTLFYFYLFYGIYIFRIDEYKTVFVRADIAYHLYLSPYNVFICCYGFSKRSKHDNILIV